MMSSSVLGAGFRIGGAIGKDETQILTGNVADAFATNAHRFALIIPAALTAEQHAVVAQILELHRPAHTLVEVCTVGAGMRVGRGLHVALTSLIGPSGGFTQLQLGGNALIGRGAILGRGDHGQHERAMLVRFAETLHGDQIRSPGKLVEIVEDSVVGREPVAELVPGEFVGSRNRQLEQRR